MKFLVTGISGFVGPYLAKHLISEGHTVVGLARRIPENKLTSITYLTGDLRVINDRSADLLRSFSFDGVFHLASLTHPPTSFKDYVKYFETNATGTVNLGEALNGNCIFMQCSTPEVYGICPEEEIFETFPINPMNPYGVAKAAADLYILERTRNNKMQAFITRAGSHTGWGRPSCYSVSSDAAQIARIIKGKQEPVIKVGNLSSQRAVIDVRDVVRAYYMLMLGYMNGSVHRGEVFHVSGHNVHSMGYYLRLMQELSGVKGVEWEVDESLVRPIDIPIQILNSNKIRGRLGWEPVIPIEVTLEWLLQYWMEVV